MDNLYKNMKKDSAKDKKTEGAKNISPVGERLETSQQHENRFK